MNQLVRPRMTVIVQVYKFLGLENCRRRYTRESESSSNVHIHQVKRGGNVDVLVKRRVHWPHEAILGGANRQRLTYDHLSLTQWVQGFTRNILEKKSSSRRNTMLAHLGDLM